ncbi:hypothetical protein SAMN06295974_3805 [Plantibacter flavus]|uniref:Uncharacterized protein n=1 Tax=Plantibacter flavus TaxID=150123 RepID=A0A3N2BLF9_9MICO|nr:hypothetical protein [Plantibacter flavus]ROR76048.1 hypothetical protein EDD42_4001 [Plantibacter flavus]SMG49001.1 hypothetical protein SAMN06295974_3805 [Plantibacter flavus]
MSHPVIAPLSDGRRVQVPGDYVDEWKTDVRELNTLLGLGDWFTDGGEKRQALIEGASKDWARCDHPRNPATQVRVTNLRQAGTFVPNEPHASVWICDKRSCLLDAMAWAERQTNDTAVWIDADGAAHEELPAVTASNEPAVTLPLTPAAASKLMDEDGFVDLAISIDKVEYFDALGERGERTIEDFLHDQSFTFGLPHDCSSEPVAIKGEVITVNYTTNIREVLPEESESQQ